MAVRQKRKPAVRRNRLNDSMGVIEWELGIKRPKALGNRNSPADTEGFARDF